MAIDHGGDFMRKGVCSICQKSGIELIYEDTDTVLQYHDNWNGERCTGSYNAPETVYSISDAGN